MPIIYKGRGSRKLTPFHRKNDAVDRALLPTMPWQNERGVMHAQTYVSIRGRNRGDQMSCG